MVDGRQARRLLAAALIGALLLSSCSTRKVLPMGAEGKAFRPDPDEQALWATAEKEEAALVKRAKLYDDPQLTEYLSSLAGRLLSGAVRASGAPAPRIEVIRDPTLNLFAMPNGRVYVHTGLLSAVQNEAQLATVLGHELAHFTGRHALRVAREGHRPLTPYKASRIAADIGVAAGGSHGTTEIQGTEVLSTTANAILGLGLALMTRAAVTGYDSDLEGEADREGLERLAQAGYAPTEAPNTFKVLLQEFGGRGTGETFYFGTPTRLQERFNSNSILVQTRRAPPGSETSRDGDDEKFAARMRTVVRENAYEDIRLGRFSLAMKQLDRVLTLTPDDPVVYLYYGDLYRLQAQRDKNSGDKATSVQRALAGYERAVELDPGFADPYRQLGFLYYQQRESAKARGAFERYLALKPDAPDARRIQEYLQELGR
jgi:beta-barrel assembly-enhancing protease